MNPLPPIIGESEEVFEMLGNVKRVAGVERPVMVIGERGTGKELVSGRLHYMSGRWESPMVTLNCGAITADLVESELFGYEAGAFTGAVTRRDGRIALADGGTLMLDEVGLLPMNVQEKLLRVIEYGTYWRVGGTEQEEADVRIVAATNADLRSMVEEGTFKADLLDRLSFEVIHVPPLRNRGDDCLILARHFLARMALELGLDSDQLPASNPQFEKILKNYGWPGNVRELKNVVERALLRSPDNLVEGIDFDPFAMGNQSRSGSDVEGPESRDNTSDSLGFLPEGAGFTEKVSHLECQLVAQALESSGGHRGLAARNLKLSYHQLRGLLRKYQHHKLLEKWCSSSNS